MKMNSRILSKDEIDFAVYAITDLIRDPSKIEVDFTFTSLSPSKIEMVLQQMGIERITNAITEDCNDFTIRYEGGLTLYYNAWLFICMLIKGDDFEK